MTPQSNRDKVKEEYKYSGGVDFGYSAPLMAVFGSQIPSSRELRYERSFWAGISVDFLNTTVILLSLYQVYKLIIYV